MFILFLCKTLLASLFKNDSGSSYEATRAHTAVFECFYIRVSTKICNDAFSLLYCSLIVPFDEDDKDPEVWFLDHDYLDNMYAMFKKVNGKPHFVYLY